MPKGEGRIEIERESKSDVDMVTIWQHFVPKTTFGGETGRLHLCG